MKVFDTYANYYNLLYKEKDYETEVAYVDQLIKKYKPGASSLILAVGQENMPITLARKTIRLKVWTCRNL